MKKNPQPRLTMKTARELALKVLGTAKGLEKDQDIKTADIYKMRLGMIRVEVRYDWYGSGCLCAFIYNPWGGTIYMLFDPKTLEEDFEAEDQQKKRNRQQEFFEWVGSYGPEICKEQIDKVWNENR